MNRETRNFILTHFVLEAKLLMKKLVENISRSKKLFKGFQISNESGKIEINSESKFLVNQTLFYEKFRILNENSIAERTSTD